MSKVGFTGTRQGMSNAQFVALGHLIDKLKPTEFHHGDCEGADASAATIADHMEPRPVIHCWPPVKPDHRAYTKFNDVTHIEQQHFGRNRSIVAATDILIGVSLLPRRQSSGGTWYTIDHAIKQGKTVYVIWPDGKVQLLQGG